MAGGIAATLEYPLDDGIAGSSPDVPGVADISIDGRPYMADTSFEPYRREAYRQRSIEATRQATDITNIPGEASVNQQGLWRREAQDWSRGAGQLFYDRRDSDAARFRTSKGVNPWVQWKLSLLNDTVLLEASADTDIQTVVVGSYCYMRTSTTLKFSTDGVTWTTVTGTPGLLKSITSDGFNIWLACHADGIYATTAGAASASSYCTGNADLIAYANGRLMAAYHETLYNITVSGTAVGSGANAALFAHEDTNFVWNCMCGGSGWIYCGGFSNNYSEVYRTQLKPDGVTMTVPVLSTPFPHGENVTALYNYANFILVGTDLGARFCETLSANDPGGNAGDLKLGPIIPGELQPVTAPVRCFTGQGRFIWFGLSNFDAISTGLGRMDISTFIDTQAPAQASDLMVTGQGEVLSADWFNGAPVFTVSGLGLYTQSPNLVPEGTLRSGYETYGLPDDKIAMFLDVKPQPNSLGTFSASLVIDDGTPYNLPTAVANNGKAVFDIPQLRGELLETELQLFPDVGLLTGPTILRSTLKAYPAVVSGSMISAVIDLFDTVSDARGKDYAVDPYFEWNYLENLRQTQKAVVYAEGTVYRAIVTIDQIDRLIDRQRVPEKGGGFEMVLVVYMKTITG